MNQRRVELVKKVKGSLKNFVTTTVANQLKLDLVQVENAFDCPTKIEFTVEGHNVSVLIED